MASGTNARGARLDRARQLGRSANPISTKHQASRASRPAAGRSTPRASLAVAAAAAAALATTALIAPRSAYATSDVWDGQTSGVWADSTNWATDPAVVPGTGDTATFNGPGNGNTTIDLGGGVTIGAVLFDTASAAAYTIGSGSVGSQTLTLDNGGAISSTSTVAANRLFNAALALGNDGSTSTFTLTNNSTTNGMTFAGNISGSTGAGVKTLAIAGGGNTTIGGVISNGTTGTVGLTKSDAGTLTLGGANTYSGGTTINAGTVTSTVGAGFGTGTVAIDASGTANFNLGANANVANVFTGSGVLSATGAFTPTLTNTSSLNGFSGTLNVNTTAGGKLAVNGAGANIGSGATVNIASGATLYLPIASTINGVTFNLAGAGNTENLGALRLENGTIIGSSSSIVASGNTQLGHNGTSTASTVNAVISETGGSRSVEKVGSGTTVFAGNNTYTGATILTGGTLSVSTDSAGAYNLGGAGTNGITFNGGGLRVTGTAITNFGSHTPTFNATKTVTLDIADAANNFTVSQALNQTTGQLIKLGAGTLTSSGANTYTGGTRANAGTLVLSGSHTYSGGTTDFFSVNNVGAQNAVVKITGGSHGFYDMPIGEATNSRGAVYQSAGTFTLNRAASTGTMRLGSGTGSYGYYNLSGGTLTSNEIGVGAGNDAVGVMDVTGGTFTQNGWLTVGRGGGTSSGVLNVTGGAVEYSKTIGAADANSSRLALAWGGSGAQTIVNIANGSVTGDDYIDLAAANNAGSLGAINLLSGGTLQGSRVHASNANPTALLNFNGGTLRAHTTNAGVNFVASANIDAVTVYSGGGTIDNNGTNVTVSRPLAAPTGNGVTSIAVTNGGSGYIGAPMVKITGGTGNTATGYAVMADDGTGNGTYTVGSIVITSPGTYSVDPTTVTLTGGGASTAATIGSITTGANSSGGMTFSGTGTTTLTAANTYTGATTVSAGTLALGGTAEINTSSGITVNGSGARFRHAGSVAVTPTVTLNNGTVDGTGTINTVNVADSANNHIVNGNNGSGVLTIGALTLDGAASFDLSAANTSPVILTNTLTTGAVNAAPGIVTVNASRPLGTWTSGQYDLISYNTLGGVGFSSFAQGTIGGLTSRQMATLTNPSGFISLLISGDNPVWTGALSGNWTTATLAEPKNWKVTTGTTDFIAGDAVRFDDTATGATALNIADADVSPTNVVFENSTLDYTVSSSGGFGIAGSGSLTKNGAGSVTLSTNNSYTGGTTVNAGTLTLSGSNNFGTGATTVNGGTLNLANAAALGTSTLNLAGGTLDNTSGSAMTLSNAQNWNGDFAFGGSNALNLAGAVALGATNVNVTTNGTGTLTVGGAISGTGRGFTKLGAGTMVLTGNNTYTGPTVVRAGELQVTAGTTGVLGADIILAPETADVATMTVTGGTINANRLVLAGSGANNTSPGTAVLNQSGGTINSQQWFTVGSGGNVGTPAPTGGTGTYNFSGGVHNINTRQMEVANFNGATGTVNMSGTAALNLRNNQTLSLGSSNNAANGTFNQDGGTVTFYSDVAGTTVGGTGVLLLGGAGTLTSTQTYNLNAGTLTVPQIQRNTANQATANFNFNGGTLKAARTNATYMFGLTRANVRNGGAIVDTNGFDVTVAQPLLHSNIGGDAAVDGGLTKNGAGTLTLGGGESTYTGNTVINAGTLKLPTYVAPVMVGNYSFDELPDGGLAGGTVVPNSGTGGTAMDGAVNHADNPFADPSSTTVGAGRFGKGLTFDGLGSSVDVANRIVDQAGNGSWTLSAWVKTPQPGSTLLVKNAGGNTWQGGHSEFYLGTNPINGSGTLPTAVRFSGGFVQGNQAVADDGWHMITFVADAGAKAVYVDGVPVTLNFAAFNNADTATLVRMGFHGNTIVADGGAHFFGTMDEMKFFTGALTAGQVQGLFSSNTFTPVNGRQYLPAATAVSIPASGATLDLGGNDQTIGSLSGVAGTAVALGSGTLTTGGDNTSTTFAGTIGGSGGVTKVGTGTQTFTGTNTYTGGTTVNAGTLQVTRMHENNSVNIAAGAKLQVLDSSPTLPNHPSGDNAFVSRPSSLTIATGGTLDLGNNDLIIDYSGATSPLAAIEDMIASGFNGGEWNGPGIISSTALNDPNFVLAVAENALLLQPFGDGGAGDDPLFAGQVVDDTTVLVKFTHRVDLDLDGLITGNDAAVFNAFFNEGQPATWQFGDLDYDGVYSGNDAAIFNGFYNESLASVPEPTSLVVAACGAAPLSRRRRRR